MAEINNSLAAQVNAGTPLQPFDISKTLGTISQIQLAQAHAGLFGLQSQQQQRQLNALKAAADAYTSGKDPVGGYLAAAGDPAGASTLQNVYYEQKARNAAGGGIFSPQQVEQLAGADKSRADTRKVGVETADKRLEVGAKVAQMIISDPSDAGIERAHQAARDAGIDTNPLSFQQMLRMRPEERVAAAKAKVAGGISSADYTAPHNVPPTDAINTRGGMLATPVPSTPSVVGDKEAVQSGMYAPTAAEQAQGWVRPPPSSRVAQTFGTMQPAMTPGQVKENEAYGGELAKTLPALGEKADAARNMNFTLDQMKAESEKIPMGKGAATTMATAQWVKSLADKIPGLKEAIGDPLADPVAAYENLNKNSGILVRQAVKEVSPRAAVQEFQMIQGQLPSADMSRGGFKQIVNQFQAVNDYSIAKHQAGQAYRDATGSMDGFDAQWNKNVTPSAFLVAGLPPDQQGALKANLEKTAEGRTTLKSLQTQLKWAHDHNLDAMVK